MTFDIRIDGLRELQKSFRQASPLLAKQLTGVHRTISTRIVSDAKGRVQGLPSPGGTRAMSGITARATQKSAGLALLASNPTIRANVFGTLSHKAWGHHVSGRGPWQSWLGRSWTPDQLYGVGPAIEKAVEGFALDEYMEAVMDSFRGMPQ